jgi:hypothetical protein
VAGGPHCENVEVGIDRRNRGNDVGNVRWKGGEMNREYLLDSLDGLKALVFRLLPVGVAGSIACVPMTTDGPWTDAEKAVFETALGIPGERMFWSPGGFVNVPPSSDSTARSKWVAAVGAINHRYLFLDPDTGFFTHHNGESEKKVLVGELALMLRCREALIIYRHQYWPNPKPGDVPMHVHPYVWHGLRMLRGAGLAAFAYQSQAASFFFVAKHDAGIEPFHTGLQLALSGISAAVIARRLIT